MEVPTNPTRPSAFVWICGSFLISANEIRVSREGFFGTGTEMHGDDLTKLLHRHTGFSEISRRNELLQGSTSLSFAVMQVTC
jgi:hypothetical protein